MKLLETKKGNMWLGAVYYYYGRVQYYLGAPGMVLTFVIFWQTGGWKYIPLPFPATVALVFICGFVLLIFDHKYATPSIAAFANMVNKEQNPILEEIKELRKEVKELKNDRTRPL